MTEFEPNELLQCQAQVAALEQLLEVQEAVTRRKSHALEEALSALKQTQAMLVHQEKMASIGQMTAGVAHEINNPIAFVSNNDELLSRDFEDLLTLVTVVKDALPELALACPGVHTLLMNQIAEIDLEHVSRAIPRKIAANREGLERVKEIVLDLRNFSRLDEACFKPFELNESIDSTLRFLRPLIETHRVAVATDFAPLSPLVGSPGSLNQAISIVIANAIQASRQGQSVCVSTFEDHENCFVSVEDEGIGIPPENLPKVFEPFFTTKPAGSGTGLGLSIAHNIIAAHRGDISIDSTPGKGTTVRIRIPRENAARRPEPQEAGLRT